MASTFFICRCLEDHACAVVAGVLELHHLRESAGPGSRRGQVLNTHHGHLHQLLLTHVEP